MLDPHTAELVRQLGFDPSAIEALLSWGMILTVATLLAAVPTGIIAKRKGRSVGGWVVFALSLPIIPLLIIWMMPSRKVDQNQS
jgi:hypothetical protein